MFFVLFLALFVAFDWISSIKKEKRKKETEKSCQNVVSYNKQQYIFGHYIQGKLHLLIKTCQRKHGARVNLNIFE